MTKTMSIRMDRDNYEFLNEPGCLFIRSRKDH
jgi:hypothetical protein